MPKQKKITELSDFTLLTVREQKQIMQQAVSMANESQQYLVMRYEDKIATEKRKHEITKTWFIVFLFLFLVFEVWYLFFELDLTKLRF